MVDSKTAMFVSGNLVHFLDLEDKTLTYMRSSTGGGIGHATVRTHKEGGGDMARRVIQKSISFLPILVTSFLRKTSMLFLYRYFPLSNRDEYVHIKTSRVIELVRR